MSWPDAFYYSVHAVVIGWVIVRITRGRGVPFIVVQNPRPKKEKKES